MEGPVAPITANHGDNMNANNANANQDNDNNDNNAPDGPNALPSNQPATNQPAPNPSAGQPAPYQPPPNQPVPHQPAPNQPAPAKLAGPTMPVPNPLQPFSYQPAPQIIYHQMINWTHFKPEFTGKPEEDAEAHLLRTNDWMRTQNFDEDVKVKSFCFTLLGEARVRYETLAPIANDWPAMQNNFQQQYSKLGNTPEQYFPQWRSFYIDENMDSIDSYVTKVSQSATMLN